MIEGIVILASNKFHFIKANIKAIINPFVNYKGSGAQSLENTISHSLGPKLVEKSLLLGVYQDCPFQLKLQEEYLCLFQDTSIHHPLLYP